MGRGIEARGPGKGPQSGAAWWELEIEVPTALAEDAGALLVAAGAGGVELITDLRELPPGDDDLIPRRPPTPGHALLVASYSRDLSSQEIVDGAQGALWELGLKCGLTGPELREDAQWAERWKRYFKPLRAAGTLWVVPAWERNDFVPCEEDAIVLTIDPGMAFGTGQHPTTALCLAVLESHLPQSPGRLLDVGSGSGLLSFAASALGAPEVLGIDIDPLAVTAARDNSALNPVFAKRVRFQDTPLAQVPDQFPWVVANILAVILMDIAPDLCGHLAPGGCLLLSGLLVEQEEQLLALFQSHREAQGQPPFAVVDRLTQNGWVALLLR